MAPVAITATIIATAIVTTTVVGMTRPFAIIAIAPVMAVITTIPRLIAAIPARFPGLDRVDRPSGALFRPATAMVDLMQRLSDSSSVYAGLGFESQKPV